jgi:hypothetical protein
MSYKLKVIKDGPVGFWMLDETSGTTATDISGCGNNGIYTGGLTTGLMPLVPGGVNGTNITSSKSISFPITKDYSGSISGGNIADKYSLDNDFSIELWLYPKITTTNQTRMFADPTSEVGLYYIKGSILFKIGTETIYYTLPNLKKAYHIVAVYSVNALILYCDGVIVGYKNITSTITLSNTSTTFQSGPTANANDSFTIDAIALYRYSLKQETVYSHFTYGQPINPIQLATPENGILFSLNDENVRRIFEYSYPYSKSLENFTNDDVVFNQEDQSISIIPSTTVTAKSAEFSDYIVFPTNIGITNSKIEWSGENGITVETSIDGSTYTACVNGQNIPQYAQGSFATGGKIYIKFTLSTEDASKYIPKLLYLNISLFRSINLRADNSGYALTPVDEEYYLGRKNYNILSRDYRNGLRCQADGGFNINTDMLVKTIEFFYTPTAYTDSGLISSLANTTYFASNYSWRNSGTVSKTNIAAIYVNGVNKTSETAVANVFTLNELHHVLIVYTEPISNDIKFNSSLYGSKESLYKNIIIYPTAFDSTKALKHYNLYIQNAAEVIYANTSDVTLTESALDVYNNDWILVQSS